MLRNILQKKDITQPLEQSRNRQTAKTMGGFDLTLLGIGAVIGTGVMVLTGITAAKNAGPSVIFSFIIATVVCDLATIMLRRNRFCSPGLRKCLYLLLHYHGRNCRPFNGLDALIRLYGDGVGGGKRLVKLF